MTPQPCDGKYETAAKAYEHARVKLKLAVQDCLLISARRLATVGAMLGDAKDLSLLRTRIRTGVSERDLHKISEAVGNFVDHHDMLHVNFAAETPTTHFLAAVLALRDALSYRESHLDEAYRDTVRCRASLDAVDHFRP